MSQLAAPGMVVKKKLVSVTQSLNLQKWSCGPGKTIPNDEEGKYGRLQRNVGGWCESSCRDKTQACVGNGGKTEKAEAGLLDVAAQEVGESCYDQGRQGQNLEVAFPNS